MANQDRNSSSSNVHRFGREHSRPYASSSMLLACRKCDKIFISAQSLIEHYQSHDNEPARQGTNFPLYPRERSNPFNHRVAPPSVFHQRPHPYLPTRYRTNSSFLAPTQTPQPFQPRNHAVTSDGNLVVPQPYPVLIRENVTSDGNLAVPQPYPPVLIRENVTSDGNLAIPQPNPVLIQENNSAASVGPFVLTPPERVPRLQLGLSLNGRYQRTVPFMRIEDQKGYDESGDKRTIWYLGKLDRQIPKIIDLESQDDSDELVGLSLRR